MNVSGLEDLNEQKVEEFLYLLVFVWSENSVDTVGKKNKKW